MMNLKQSHFLKKSFIALASVILGFTLSVFTLSGSLGSASLIPLAYAEDEDKPELDIGPTCPGEYYGFIVGARNEDMRKNYFKDFFTLSYCQLSDIQQVYDELESLRDDFRSAAFACEDTSDYKAQYYELLMEVYFIRNLQWFSAGVFQSEDQEWVEGNKVQILENLKSDMKKTFVDDHAQVSDSTLDDYFDQWSQEYDERIFNYALCDDGPWAQVNDSVETLTETISYLSTIKQQFKDEIEVSEGNSFTNLTNTSLKEGVDVNANDQAKLVGQGILNTWEYLTKAKEQNIQENVESPKSLDEAIASGEVRSISEAFALLNDQEEIYEIATDAETRMARYEILYGQSGSVAAAELQGVVGLMNISLSNSIKSINGGNGDDPALLDLVKNVHAKQCQ